MPLEWGVWCCGSAFVERRREQPDFKGLLRRRRGDEDMENFENVFQSSSVVNNRSPLDRAPIRKEEFI